MFLKDSSGKKSLTATMAVISFMVVMVKVLLSGSSVTIAGNLYSFGTIDAATVASIFTPILGSYTARRWGTNNDGGDDSGGKPGDGAA